MKILLTGATGFLGWRTLEVLVADSRIQEIIATGRTLRHTHKCSHPKVTYVLGDLEDTAFVNGLVSKVDYIVHAAALSSPWGAKELFEKANVLSQENLIRAAKGNGIKNFVFISTPSLYFEFKDRFDVKEEDELPDKFVNEYARTKRKAEILLAQSGLPYVILRPRALIGRGDTIIMPRLIRAFDEGRLKIIGDGNNVADLTSVENVSNAILLALLAENEALNQTYNITNGEPVVLWEAISDILGQLGKTLPAKKVSYKLVKFTAKLLEIKSKLSNNKEPALTQYGVGTLAMSLTMDITKAKRLLAYQPKVSTQEAINEFVDWYKNNEAK